MAIHFNNFIKHHKAIYVCNPRKIKGTVNLKTMQCCWYLLTSTVKVDIVERSTVSNGKTAVFSMAMLFNSYVKLPEGIDSDRFYIWLVVSTPLKNTSQLGWWFLIIWKNMFQTPTRYLHGQFPYHHWTFIGHSNEFTNFFHRGHQVTLHMVLVVLVVAVLWPSNSAASSPISPASRVRTWASAARAWWRRPPLTSRNGGRLGSGRLGVGSIGGNEGQP